MRSSTRNSLMTALALSGLLAGATEREPALRADDKPAAKRPTGAPAAGPGEAARVPESFAKLHALINRSPGEMLYLNLPWVANLTEARRKAAQEGKPILLVRAASGDACALC